jgi:hypothetical protein
MKTIRKHLGGTPMTHQTLISTLLASALFIGTAMAQTSAKPLTNDDVLSLTRTGLGENTILTVIGAQASKFDVSGSDLLKLKDSGVSPRVVAAIVTSASAPSVEQPAATAETEAALPSGPANAPAAPAKKKRPWLKALASPTVGQVLAAAASQFASQTDPLTGQVKNTVLARVTGIASSLMNGPQPNAIPAAPTDQAPGMMVPYAGGMVQNAPVPMMMVPAYGYAPQGQPVMMQPVVMPGSVPAGIPMPTSPQYPSNPVAMNVVPNGPATDSTAQITVVNGQPMVRLVSPDGQAVLIPLASNQVVHEAPVVTPKVNNARGGENRKATSHQ